MHQNPRRSLRLVAAAAASLVGLGLTFGAAAPAVAAPTISGATISVPSTVTAGATFDVTVALTAATDVYGYEAVLAFDPAVVAYIDGSAVVTAGGFHSVRTASGSVELVYTRLGTSPALSGDVTFSLSFTATAAGSTAFTLGSLSLVDPASAVTASTNAATNSVTVVPAAVVTPTPGPGSDPGGSGGSGGSGAGTDTAAASPGAAGLASTGSAIAPYLLGALALIVVGAAAVLFTIRRRRTGEAR